MFPPLLKCGIGAQRAHIAKLCVMQMPYMYASKLGTRSFFPAATLDRGGLMALPTL